jgi:hypothetical protein
LVGEEIIDGEKGGNKMKFFLRILLAAGACLVSNITMHALTKSLYTVGCVTGIITYVFVQHAMEVYRIHTDGKPPLPIPDPKPRQK